MSFVSKNCSLEKVAFMNSSCFMICVLDSFYKERKGKERKGTLFKCLVVLALER